jgi:hypothetical protein
MDTNQPLFENGQPVMGVFFAMAFPKVLPDGQANTEFEQFFGQMRQVAAASWPALFPQGAAGPCANPRFSWKYQDGDGTDQSGKSVADKSGFKGHHIIKFYTAYPVRCYNEGHFAAHEELQAPNEVIKRGYWIRVVGEMKSNNATGSQVPGIKLYPKLVSFVQRGEEIASGPDAQEAFGKAPTGWRPAPMANDPIPTPGGLPAMPAVGGGLPAMPAVGGGLPAMPAVGGGLPAMPAVGGGLPAITLPTPPQPTYPISPTLAAQGVTIDMLLAQGWTHDALVAQGHATKA